MSFKKLQVLSKFKYSVFCLKNVLENIKSILFFAGKNSPIDVLGM